jgi:hypothetical protein
MTESALTRARLPRKFTPQKRETLLIAAGKGYPKETCAELAGISYETLRVWLANPEELEELAEFAAEFAAARAQKIAELQDSIDEAGNDVEGTFTDDGQPLRLPRRGDWQARKWLLTVISPPHRLGSVSGQLGLKPTEEAGEMTERQLHHRVIQMIAHPSPTVQGLIRQALGKGNATLQAIVEEHVEERRRKALEESSVETTGEEFAARELPEDTTEPEEFVEEHDPAVRRAPMTPELEYRLSEFRRVLKQYDRVAMGGIPISGKGLFMLECTDRVIIHTDTYKDKAWDMVPSLANAECAGHSRYLLVGVRATGCIREGLNADVLVWLGEPMEPPLPESLRAMAKGRETALSKLMDSMPELKVVRI